MRLRQIIKESAPNQRELLKKYFLINGEVEFWPDGIEVAGVVDSIVDFALPEIPVKFKKARHFNIQGPLKNLNNFPNEATQITVTAPELESTSNATGDIECIGCTLEGCGKIQDFSNTSIKTNQININNCANLKSLRGLDLSLIRRVTLENCPNFEDDLGKIGNIQLVIIYGNIPENMPIMRFFMQDKLVIYSPHDDRPITGAAAIVRKYLDMDQPGAKLAMSLMRELKDNGYFNAARM